MENLNLMIDIKSLDKTFKEIIKCEACSQLKLGYIQDTKEEKKLKWLRGPLPAVFDAKNYKGVLFLAQNPGLKGYKKQDFHPLEQKRFNRKWKSPKDYRKEVLNWILLAWDMYWWIPLLKIDHKQCAFLESYKCSSGIKTNTIIEYTNKYSSKMFKQCNNTRKFTLKEINALNPKIIITVGGISQNYIKRNKSEIKNYFIHQHLKHTSRFQPEKKDLSKLRKKIEEALKD